MDLTSVMGRALRPAARLRSAQNDIWDGVTSAAVVTAQKPVIQVNKLPESIDLAAYANPLSGTNPGGSPKNLFRFRQLTDPVPFFDRYYGASTSSTETLWGNMVNGASVESGASFAMQMLSGAQLSFANARLGNLDGSPGGWRPVYALPDNWYDIQKQNFEDVTLDMSGTASPDGPYATIGTAAVSTPAQSLHWRITNPGETEVVVPLGSGTAVRAIHFKALEVILRRPWIDPSLFSMKGIYLSGQSAGFYSSGQLANNAGILPLLTSSFYLAKDIRIEGDWAPADLNVLALATQNTTQVALANFALSSGPSSAGQPFAAQIHDGVVSAPSPQVIAWLSELVPLFPAADG